MSTKAKTRQEIANEYSISTKTLKKWLTKNEISIPRGLVSPKDQIKIYNQFGIPKASD